MDRADYRPLDRRPIRSRDLALLQRIAAWLAAKRVSPNAISMAGMASGLAAGAALWATPLLPSPWERAAWVLGAALVQFRLLMNLFDGMVAIASGRASPLGEIYNEAPDRISDAAVLIGLGYAAGGNPALGYLAACAALFTAYVRTLGKCAGAPQEFCGPMAKQERMFVVTVVALYSGLTPPAWKPSWGAEGKWGLPALALFLILSGALVTSARRLRRIASHLRKPPP